MISVIYAVQVSNGWWFWWWAVVDLQLYRQRIYLQTLVHACPLCVFCFLELYTVIDDITILSQTRRVGRLCTVYIIYYVHRRFQDEMKPVQVDRELSAGNSN